MHVANQGPTCAPTFYRQPCSKRLPQEHPGLVFTKIGRSRIRDHRVVLPFVHTINDLTKSLNASNGAAKDKCCGVIST